MQCGYDDKNELSLVNGEEQDSSVKEIKHLKPFLPETMNHEPET
jgi:hypothetical protein